jgi:outer membrane murein-binding lipoprotein Lpp
MEELKELMQFKNIIGGLGIGGLFIYVFLKKILVSERVGADAISKQKAIAEQYEKKVVELYIKLEQKDAAIELMRSQLFAAEMKQARAEGKLQAMGIEFDNDDTSKEDNSNKE